MKTLLIRAAAMCGIVFLSLAALGQSANITGLPTFGTMTGGPDLVNLSSLDIHYQIPAMNKAGRGLPVQFALAYDSYPSWMFVNPVFNRPTYGWNQPLNMGYVTYSTAPTCPTDPNATNYGNWAYVDGNGTVHPFPASLIVSSDANCHSTQASATATDQSGYAIVVNSTPGVVSLKDSSGNGYTTSVLPNVALSPFVYPPPAVFGAGSITDRNGNVISTDGANYYKDTLGMNAVTISDTFTSGGILSSVTYTYNTVGGGTASVVVSYIQYAGVATQYGCGNDFFFNGIPGTSLPSTITYADGSKYSFAYEASSKYSGYTTGRITSVTLPTGGTISYAYQGSNSGVFCSDLTTANMTRTTPDGRMLVPSQVLPQLLP